MKNLNVKSQFRFNRSERIGILFLLLVIIGLLYVQLFVSFASQPTLDVSSSEILSLQIKIDSLRQVEIENRKPKIYPFNPNFITDHKAYMLGMSPEQYDRLKMFRKKNLWIHSKTDFQKVTKVSDSLLAEISPYFKFPEWVTNPKPKKQYAAHFRKERPYTQKIDINEATVEDLQKVYGIGDALSKRIIDRRSQLGGFSDKMQLYHIWGLKSTVVENLLRDFAVKTPKPITKLDINTASASDLATIPGVSFDKGKKIWEYVRLREGIADLAELSKIEDLSKRELQLIQLYLWAE